MILGSKLPSDYQIAHPRLIVMDKNQKELVDSITPGVALDSFNYSFNEEGADEGSITFKLTNVDQFNALVFRKYQSIFLQWGYIDDLCEPIRVLITLVKETYNASGLTLVLSFSDDFSVLSSGKNPILLKAENLKKYLECLPKIGLVVQALKAQQNNQTVIKDYATGEVIQVDCVLAPYLVSLRHRDKVQHDAAYYHHREFNMQDIPGHWTPLALPEAVARVIYQNETGIPYGGEVEYCTEEGLSLSENEAKKAELKQYIKNLNNTEKPHPDIKQTTLPDRLFFGIPPDAQAEGQTIKEVVTNLLEQSTTDQWSVTGHGNRVIIYNRNLHHDPTREYTFGEEPGYLLDINFSTDSIYSSDDSALSRLTVNPENGALTVKEFMDNKKNITDVEQYAMEEAQRVLESIEASTEVVNNIMADYPSYLYNPQVSMESDIARALYDPNGSASWMKGNLDPNVMNLAPLREPESTRTEADYTLREVDGQSIRIPIYRPKHVINAPVVVGEAEAEMAAIDQVIQNIKGDSGKKRLKATATLLGDPSVVCHENVIIKGVSKKYIGRYHVTNATHTIGRSGYTVSIEMYPIGPLPTGVITADKKVEKKEAVDKACKTCPPPGYPVIPDPDLIERFPKKDYRITYYNSKTGKNENRIVLGTDWSMEESNILGLKNLGTILPGYSPNTKIKIQEVKHGPSFSY